MWLHPDSLKLLMNSNKKIMMMLVIMAKIRLTLNTNDDNDGVDLQSRLELQRTMEERNVGRSRWSRPRSTSCIWGNVDNIMIRYAI